MPVITTSTYQPLFPWTYRHVNTIYPAFFRKVEVAYERERIITPDEDFFDVDFSRVGSQTGVIILHGLEGSSDSTYIKSLTRAVNKQGWDAIAMNLRTCSGEPNLLPSAYHSGMSEDLKVLVEYLADHTAYDSLMVVGFSLGGNITLKYMGEQGSRVHSLIKAAIGISVPVMLRDTAYHLAILSNQLYLQGFLYTLREKTRYKMEKFPDAPFDWNQILKARNFEEFDNLYTAPAHGFKDAEAYWALSSSRQYLSEIQVPTLLINALDDPFLPDSCHPFPEAEASKYFFFEAPENGGHVGFVTRRGEVGEGWIDKRVIDFLEEMM